MLSNTAEYALRAMIYLAEREGEGPVRADDVAESLDVPRNYLSKILHTLVKAEILRSSRGPKGGFELARPSSSVTLYDVVVAFDDIEARRTCLLGRKECSDRHPCAVHGLWKNVATEIAKFFRDTTMEEVVGDAKKVGAILGH